MGVIVVANPEHEQYRELLEDDIGDDDGVGNSVREVKCRHDLIFVLLTDRYIIANCLSTIFFVSLIS